MNMNKSLYLKINGVAYIALGLLCAVLPGFSAHLIGLDPIGQKGIAEYVAVYGGLEFGMGMFFLLSLPAERQYSGLLFGFCVYTGIVIFRVGAMLLNGPTTDFGWVLFSLESFMFLWSIWLYRTETRQGH
jgi:hypothetical protein